MENTEKSAEQTKKDAGQTVPEENKIAIQGHTIFREGDDSSGYSIVIELNIKNVMNKTVGSVVFEASFSDKDGNVNDIVEQKVSGLGPEVSRTIRLVHKEDPAKPVENYNVKVRDIVMVPESVACGNDMVAIKKHNFKYLENVILEGVECGIQNISDKTIATLIIECTFFDSDGNVLNVTKHKETNLLPGNIRGIIITPPITVEGFRISTYNVRIFRVVTADVEKVQVIKNEIRTNGNEKEVSLICKNISSEKTDAAIIVKFFNDSKDDIGTKVIPVKDLEPGTTRQLKLNFKPAAGDNVSRHEITVGDLVE